MTIVKPAVRLLATGTVSVLVGCGGGGGGSSSTPPVVNRPPVAEDFNLDAEANKETVFEFQVSDPDGDALSISFTEQPLNGDIQVDGIQGTYIPDPDFIGSDSMTYLVGDGQTQAGPARVEITVDTGANDPPEIETTTFETDEDVPLDDLIVGSDPDLDPIEYRLDANAANGDVTLNVFGFFQYVPDPDFFGTDTFSVIASDGMDDSPPTTITVTIAPINDPPRITIASVPPQDEFDVFRLTANVMDIEGDAITPLGWNAPLGIYFGIQEIDPFTLEVIAESSPVQRQGAFRFSARDSFNARGDGFVTVTLNAGTDTDADRVTDFYDSDDDYDGFADFYEVALNTDPLDPTSTPEGIDPASVGVSFDGDSDGDGVVDYLEIYKGTDPNDPASTPIDTDVGNSRPLVMGFAPDPNIVDVTTGNEAPSVTFTVIQPVGLEEMYFSFGEDQGIDNDRIAWSQNIAGSPLIYAGRSTGPQLDPLYPPLDLELRYVFANWGIPGETTAATFTRGSLGPDGKHEFAIVNANTPDLVSPELVGFDVLTPTIDPSAGNVGADFRVQTTDAGSGVERVEVTLRADSSIAPYNAHSFGFLTVLPPETSGDLVVASQPFAAGIPSSEWRIERLRLLDAADNRTDLFQADLDARGFATTFSIDNTNPDTDGPSLESLEILTPVVDTASADPTIRFRLRASDPINGLGRVQISIAKLPLMPLSPGFAISMDFPANPNDETFELVSPALVPPGDIGSWVIRLVDLTDSVGVFNRIDTAELTTRGIATEITVQ